MSEAKFTKGEWNIQFGDMIFASDGVNNEQVAVVCNEGSLDAYLIAAAPDMYLEIERDIHHLTRRIESEKRKEIIIRLEVERDRKFDLLSKARGEL